MTTRDSQSQPRSSSIDAVGLIWTYVVVGVVVLIGILALQTLKMYQGNRQLHTNMEVVATLLALIVGALALVRFYSKKDNTYLFVGVGFVGTALLDGYHAVVTSDLLAYIMPSPPESLIPWSWNASRTFLAIVMAFSWWAWRREEKLGAEGRIGEVAVYASVLVLTLLSFCVFALVPLPRAYYPEFLFGRPEEFIAAGFFLVALVGYLDKAHWQHNSFEHWLVLSLITGFLGQSVAMSRSFALFDVMFDVAHVLKIVTYGCVLTGLLINVYQLFTQNERNANVIRQTVTRLTPVSKEIAIGVQQQVGGLTETATSLNQMTTTAEQFKATIQEFVDRARAVQDAIEETASQAAEGRTLTQQSADRSEAARDNAQSAGESVLRFTEQMQRIGEITIVVNEIAEQTKLLALNASIEAARAGEEGRGFAVVATQVRELANQSKEAAIRINGMIGDSQKSLQDVVSRIQDGSRLSGESAEIVGTVSHRFERIAVAIAQTSDAMKQIAIGAQQQQEGVSEMVAGMTEVDKTSRASLVTSEQTQKSILLIDDQIQSLNETITKL
jgi:methyl-accepting chemotaxis protein